MKKERNWRDTLSTVQHIVTAVGIIISTIRLIDDVVQESKMRRGL